jgi:hypothetical protein
VQARIARGEVAIGFTPAQVRTAADEPDRVNQLETAEGIREIWTYTKRRPKLGLGFGVGGGSGGIGIGTGVNVGLNSFDAETRLRVTFRHGSRSAPSNASDLLRSRCGRGRARAS